MRRTNEKARLGSSRRQAISSPLALRKVRLRQLEAAKKVQRDGDHAAHTPSPWVVNPYQQDRVSRSRSIDSGDPCAASISADSSVCSRRRIGGRELVVAPRNTKTVPSFPSQAGRHRGPSEDPTASSWSRIRNEHSRKNRLVNAFPQKSDRVAAWGRSDLPIATAPTAVSFASAHCSSGSGIRRPGPDRPLPTQCPRLAAAARPVLAAGIYMTKTIIIFPSDR
jgi:hypothetical protein